MLACVYPAESFKSKAVTVKLRHGKSRKKPKLLSVKEKSTNPRQQDANDTPNKSENELPVGGGGAVLVLSELESMAARQQREIAQQRRLLEQREARLAVLRGAQDPAQQDKLARLRHRLDQQQSKLNRLRLLRSQTDQSRAKNATLTSDLDCIRALFNEKEKELSLAVAKVEELTRQLEELRGRQNGAGTGSGGGGAGGVGGGGVGGAGGGHLSTPASAELEKLRRELMYRNKVNEQQNQVVSQQRLALAQRQAEMASIDARIAQLQGRLQRKRALNQRLSQQLGSGNRTNANTGFTESKLDFNAGGKSRPAGNIAAIEPYSHIPNDNDFNLNKNDPKYQTLPYNTKFTVNFKAAEDDVNKNKIQHSASASQLGQRAAFQQFGHQIAHSQSQSHIQGQSQLLGTNQQQHNQNVSNQPVNLQQTCNNNNNNNNSNNNNNNSNNNLISSSHNFSPEGLSQNLRIHHQQQSQTQQQQQQLQHGNVPQKQHNVGLSASNLGSSVSITQTQNHRNLQTHQKPVSSVAPSFSVKSQIYQTSSTKIHPVMPQTLSLIGRGHNNAQNFVGLNPQNSNQQQSNQSVPCNQTSNQDQTYNSRHNYPGIQHSTQANTHISSSSVYQTQNSPNPPSTIHTSSSGSSFGNSVQRYSQNQPLTSPTSSSDQSEKMKFEQGKSQEKFEHTLPAKHEQQRYEANQVFKYDPHQIKYEHSKYDQHGKYEQSNQSSKLYEQSSKHEPSGNQGNKYDNASKIEQGKYEASQNKHEIHGNKYDPNQNTQQYGGKHDQHEVRPSVKYDHNAGFKHDGGGQQYKQEQVKFENNQNKFEQSSMTKHEHNGKFEIPAKTGEKPFEFDRLKNENERKNLGEDKTKPALPPKPSKPNPPPRLTHHEKVENSNDGIGDGKNNLGIRAEKEEDVPPIPTSEPPESPTETQFGNHQIIKARPLTLKKAPISEQPKLRYAKSNVHVSINRRIEMPPAFLFPETEIPADLMQTEQQQQQQQTQPQQQSQIIDTTDNCKKIINEDVISNEKLEEADIIDALNVINIEDKAKAKECERRGELEVDGKNNEVMRRKKGNLKSSTGKANLSRRVSFDPLALLLDASLEGELELVKKTAKEVANPSSANDEGITALHNAICAGHLEIVKFLVEFGCDVNAQDSDGWTPLHCAASCNNLSMVRFLVEHGACIFATTLSDHETAAEKCEEDEEGFDGCSEYLYSVQEKLGIMNNGQVYAVFDYEAQHSDELTLKNGDSLVVLRKGDDNEREWWWSKLGHKEGYVPRNLLGLYPRVQPAKVD